MRLGDLDGVRKSGDCGFQVITFLDTVFSGTCLQSQVDKRFCDKLAVWIFLLHLVSDLTSLLHTYTKQKEGQGIWRCPSHATMTAEKGWTSSYGYNWEYLLAPGPDYPHTGWNGFDNPGLKLAALSRPADTLCFIDHDAPKDNVNLWSYVLRPGDPSVNDGMGRPAFRHNGQANVLFCDTHVKSFGPSIAMVPNERKYWSAE